MVLFFEVEEVKKKTIPVRALRGKASNIHNNKQLIKAKKKVLAEEKLLRKERR